MNWVSPYTEPRERETQYPLLTHSHYDFPSEAEVTFTTSMPTNKFEHVLSYSLKIEAFASFLPSLPVNLVILLGDDGTPCQKEETDHLWKNEWRLAVNLTVIIKEVDAFR